MKVCSECNEEIEDWISLPLGGLCDACAIATMAPEWVKEHYPEYADVED